MIKEYITDPQKVGCQVASELVQKVNEVIEVVNKITLGATAVRREPNKLEVAGHMIAMVQRMQSGPCRTLGQDASEIEEALGKLQVAVQTYQESLVQQAHEGEKE